MRHLFLFLTIIRLSGPGGLFAQTDSSRVQLSWSGYVEPYFSYDFGRPIDGNRPGFLYSYHRHQEVTINLALLRVSAASGRLRGNIGFMAGTYPNTNLQNEPATLRHIYEADIGFRLFKNREWWLDAGVFPAHIGFESAIGKDCPTLTRSLAAENSPYFESGVRLSRNSVNQRWQLGLLVLNGWQSIQRPEPGLPLSAGWQLQYHSNKNLTLNSSGFIGQSRPDSLKQNRVFHNFYGIYTPGARWKFILGLDTGWEITDAPVRRTRFWYGPVFISRFECKTGPALALRLEHFADPGHVLIESGAPEEFRVFGLSLNADWPVSEQLLCRLEARWLASPHPLFVGNNTRNTAVTASLAFSL